MEYSIKSKDNCWIIGITKVDVFVAVVSFTKFMLIFIVTPEIADKIQRILLNYWSTKMAVPQKNYSHFNRDIV